MSLSFCIQKVESTEVGFSYSGFNEFRHRIARSIGLKGVYPGTKTDMYETGRYKEIENTHPMYPLLDHNDNEGELGPDDCGQIGSYLELLLPEWKKELDEAPDDDLENDINQGEIFALLLLMCHTDGNTLLFR